MSLSQAKTLIFDWPGRHTLHIFLPLAILFAALLHAGIFYLFSIVYPRPEADGPEPAQIYFVPPGAGDSFRLTAILDTCDPALFAPGRGLMRGEFVEAITYTPQYEAQRAIFDPLPVISAQPPKENSTLYGPVPVLSPYRTVKKNSFPKLTRLVSAGSLAKRLPVMPEAVKFEAQLGQTLEPAVFLVAVRGDGSVAHIVLQHGSGNTLLDESVLKLLKSLSFASAPEGDEWGFVSFHWGADVQFVEAR